MDISRAFSYPRNDPGWLSKMLIMGVVSVVPILNLSAFGYMMEGIRRVSQGNDQTLPDWDNFGGYFMDGLRVMVTAMVYSIPLFLVLGAVFGVALMSGDDGEAMVGVIGLVANLFQLFWQFVLWVIWPSMLLLVAFNPGWGAGFDFGALMGNITRNVGSYVMVLLMTMAFSLVGALGILVCFVGILLTAPYAQMCTAHLIGQLAREGSNPATYS